MTANSEIADLKAEVKKALSGDDAETARDALSAFLELEPGTAGIQFAAHRIDEFIARNSLTEHRLALLTSFTADPLEPHLKVSEFLSERALKVLSVPYDQWQMALSERGEIDDFAPDEVVLLLHLEDVAPLLAHRHLACAKELAAEREQFLSAVRSCVGSFRTRSNTPVVLATMIAAQRGVERYFDRRVSPSRAALVEELNVGLSRIASETANTYVLDYAATVADFGRTRWFDKVAHHHTHCSISAAALPVLARDLTGFFNALSGPRDKVLALDLDNTLWHGVIGEDGLDGITQSGGWPGKRLSRTFRILPQT